MDELQLFPENTVETIEYLFANYGEKEALAASKIIAKLRNAGISAELYPEAGKMKKFFAYSEKRGVKNLVFVGEEEINTNTVTIKNQEDGIQRTIPVDDFLG